MLGDPRVRLLVVVVAGIGLFPVAGRAARGWPPDEPPKPLRVTLTQDGTFLRITLHNDNRVWHLRKRHHAALLMRNAAGVIVDSAMGRDPFPPGARCCVIDGLQSNSSVDLVVPAPSHATVAHVNVSLVPEGGGSGIEWVH